jgi:hypothetical protein
MHFDFASRRATGGLPTLELKGTDQLKKGSSWPHSSWVETMSTMPGETRVVINWSSEFIDKTRVCLARHPSFGAHQALSRSAFGVRRSCSNVVACRKGVSTQLEAPSRNCTCVAGWRRGAITELRLCYTAPKTLGQLSSEHQDAPTGLSQAKCRTAEKI